MRIPCLTRTALIGLISLGASGCGFLFVEGPPPGHEQMMTVPCTNSKLLPALDVAWGGLMALNGILTLGLEPGDQYYEDRNAIVAVNGAWAVVSGISASKGYKKVRECRAAKELLARRSSGQDPPDLGPQLVPIELSDPLKGPLPRRQN